MQVTRWDGENALRIACDFPRLGSPTLDERGQVTSRNRHVGFYARLSGPDALKYGVILYSRPTTNQVQLYVEGWEQYYWWYQPSFPNVNADGSTWKRDDVGALHVRPVWANGSYAVYHKTKRDHILGQTNYRTGKFCHIHRPWIFDATGRGVWGDLHIDRGVYTVTIPEAFLRTAVYPVVVNDTFGDTSTSATAISCEDIMRGITATGAAGTATGISVYCRESTTDNAHTAKCALFLAADNSFVASSSERADITTTVAWREFSVASQAITAVDYLLASWGNSATGQYQMYYDAGTGWYRNLTYGAWPNPATPIADTNAYSIYCTYTAEGGGPAPGASVNRGVGLGQSRGMIRFPRGR